MEVKIIGCSAINWFCPTDSRLQNIAGPGTACQEKGNARGKKGPVRRVFTGVLSLIREGTTPSRTRNFVLFFGNPNPNPNPEPLPLEAQIMEETPQQRDSRDNRRCSREEETPDQRDRRLERDRNRARRRRLEETPGRRQRR